MTVTATITGQTSATLRYRIDFNAEQTLAMTNSGGDTFTATIPGAAAGHLIRYRVEATNAITTSRSPRVDDTINYRGVVVPDGVTSAIPILRWFIADADYNAITGSPTADIIRPAVLAYGTTVYDNVSVNIRGQGSETTPSPTGSSRWRRTTTSTCPGCWSSRSTSSPCRPTTATWRTAARSSASTPSSGPASSTPRCSPSAPSATAPSRGSTTTSTCTTAPGASARATTTTSSSRPNINAFDSTVPLANRRFEKKAPEDTDYAPLQAFLDGVALTGTAERNYMSANADLPQLINYAAVTAIIQHVDSSTKNFYLAQDPGTGAGRCSRGTSTTRSATSAASSTATS